MPQYNLKPDGIKGFEDFSRCPNKVADWIERLSPDTVIKLGFHSTDEIWGAVNQAFSLYEEPPGADQIR